MSEVDSAALERQMAKLRADLERKREDFGGQDTDLADTKHEFLKVSGIEIMLYLKSIH